MKKIIISITLALACWSGMAQAETHEHEYLPLLEDGREWIYEFSGHAPGVEDETITDVENFDFTLYSDFYSLYLDGDTLIAGQTYMKCYYKTISSKTFGKLASEEYPVAYLREDGKKVYLIHNKRNYRYLGNLGPCYDEYNNLDDPNLDGVYWIYDFDNMKDAYAFDEWMSWSSSDEVVNGVWRTVFRVGDEPIIEGIGPDYIIGDLLNPICEPTTGYIFRGPVGLVMMKEKDGTTVYKGCRYTNFLESRLPGDVNGDGSVNVSDVTALINLILGIK